MTWSKYDGSTKFTKSCEKEKCQDTGSMKLPILENRLLKYKQELLEIKDLNNPSNNEKFQRIKQNIKFTEDRIYHCKNKEV
ncbi:conserved Plasmodium protein, unknown function [Plasmodium malariae]|uniref:Uncharacterized protein n=1 Tax=Plasmodium malariae TaxID=5858 RepID=A0A1A8WXT9_PLAMA|nr:conserved Plasmodium protein, unknown function [Plasmodium malariae]